MLKMLKALHRGFRSELGYRSSPAFHVHVHLAGVDEPPMALHHAVSFTVSQRELYKLTKSSFGVGRFSIFFSKQVLMKLFTSSENLPSGNLGAGSLTTCCNNSRIDMAPRPAAAAQAHPGFGLCLLGL